MYFRVVRLDKIIKDSSEAIVYRNLKKNVIGFIEFFLYKCLSLKYLLQTFMKI